MNQLIDFFIDCCQNVGLSPALVTSAAILVAVWVCVDFYEEHFTN